MIHVLSHSAALFTVRTPRTVLHPMSLFSVNNILDGFNPQCSGFRSILWQLTKIWGRQTAGKDRDFPGKNR
ncbi:hypothetical protein CSB45_05945 [candidate division KSB3 bacterium]|uniref:Uncharacterized protein n=1 Tax=candidate division KSB3 bacterium TaxID=2044937 RepID=A0A2G6E6Q6_9BACT|nr:MAG: hypothetical protein CSB45_05945 [candidate division KSB3 bacterium]